MSLFSVTYLKVGRGTLSIDIPSSGLPITTAAATTISSSASGMPPDTNSLKLQISNLTPGVAALATITFTSTEAASASPAQPVVFTILNLVHKSSPETDKRHKLLLECSPPVAEKQKHIFEFPTRADLVAAKFLINDIKKQQERTQNQGAAPSPAANGKAKKAGANGDEEEQYVQPVTNSGATTTSTTTKTTTTNTSSSAAGSSQKRKRQRASHAKTLVAVQTLASARAALLAAHPSLKARHGELVTSGIIAEEDFWAQHETAVSDQAAALTGAASQGRLSSDLLGSILPQGTISLDKQKMYDIFKMYPAVRKAYIDRVESNEMTSNEFWSQYFKSEYINRDKASGQRSGVLVDDDFSRMEDEMEAERRKRKVKKLAGGKFDLTTSLGVERPLGLRGGSGNMFPDREAGRADADDMVIDGATIGKKKVIQKYNKFGGIVVGADGGEDGGDDEDGDNEEEYARRGFEGNDNLHREMVELTEMAAAKRAPGDYDHVKFATVAPAAASATTKSTTTATSSSSAAPPVASAPNVEQSPASLLEYLENDLQRIHKASFATYDPLDAAARAFPEARKANTILGKLSASLKDATRSERGGEEITKKLEERRKMKDGRMADSFKTTILQFYKQNGELLRHFFSFLRNGEPSDSVRLQKVLNKIKADHEIFSKEIKDLKDQGTDLSKIKAAMIEPIKDQLSYATEKAGKTSGWT
jgi:transcription initiation factor TFIIH subunit 1